MLHTFFRTAQVGENAAYLFSDRSRGRERRIPRSGDTQGRLAKLILRQR